MKKTSFSALLLYSCLCLEGVSIPDGIANLCSCVQVLECCSCWQANEGGPEHPVQVPLKHLEMWPNCRAAMSGKIMLPHIHNGIMFGKSVKLRHICRIGSRLIWLAQLAGLPYLEPLYNWSCLFKLGNNIVVITMCLQQCACTLRFCPRWTLQRSGKGQWPMVQWNHLRQQCSCATALLYAWIMNAQKAKS